MTWRCVRSGLAVLAVSVGCGAEVAMPDEGGATGSESASTSAGPGETTASTSTSAATSTADGTSADGRSTEVEDECYVEGNDCPPGQACCQASFYDPMICVTVNEGYCGGDVECPRGLVCTPGSTHCPIGECLPPDDDSATGDSGDASTSSEATGSDGTSGEASSSSGG